MSWAVAFDTKGVSMKTIKWLIPFLFAVMGCSQGPQEPNDEGSTGEEEQALRVCNTIALCVEGYVWSPRRCACVPDKKSKGEACGSRTCGAGEYCCNASCGICAPAGGACIQIACAEPM
jgi:hypothetical protein